MGCNLVDELPRLGDTRSRKAILRELQKLKLRDRTMPIPWAVAALVRVLEREFTEAAEVGAEIEGLIEDNTVLCERLGYERECGA